MSDSDKNLEILSGVINLAMLIAQLKRTTKSSRQPVMRRHPHLPARDRPTAASEAGARPVDIQPSDEWASPAHLQGTEALIICLARGNGRWGYGKIEGELLK